MPPKRKAAAAGGSIANKSSQPTSLAKPKQKRQSISLLDMIIDTDSEDEVVVNVAGKARNKRTSSNTSALPARKKTKVQEIEESKVIQKSKGKTKAVVSIGSEDEEPKKEDEQKKPKRGGKTAASPTANLKRIARRAAPAEGPPAEQSDEGDEKEDTILPKRGGGREKPVAAFGNMRSRKKIPAPEPKPQTEEGSDGEEDVEDSEKLQRGGQRKKPVTSTTTATKTGKKMATSVPVPDSDTEEELDGDKYKEPEKPKRGGNRKKVAAHSNGRIVKKVGRSKAGLVSASEPESESESEPEDDRVDEPVSNRRGKKPTVTKGEVTIVGEPRPAALSSRGKKTVQGSKTEQQDDEDDEEDEDTVIDNPVSKPKRGALAKATAAAKNEKKLKEVDEIAETQMEPEMIERDDVDDLEVAPTPTQVHSGNKNVKNSKAIGTKGNNRGIHKSVQEESLDDCSVRFAAIQNQRKIYGTIIEQSRAAFEENKATDAEKTLEAFKKKTDDALKDAEKVINVLQEDLNRQRLLANESRALKKVIKTKDAEIAKYQGKIAELNKMVQASQKDNQVLMAKLTAAQSKTVPGSAVKGSNAIGRGVLQGPKSGSVAVDDSWTARVKEELYGDLTNLIIMGVKKESETRSFDCLQTGTNGTLHFKLCVRENPGASQTRKQNPPSANANGQDDEDEEMEFIFIPLLDSERDATVISLLPEYLRDEIQFSRDHAVNFYQKISMVLTKPISQEAGSEDEDATEDDNETTRFVGEETTMANETTIDDD